MDCGQKLIKSALMRVDKRRILDTKECTKSVHITHYGQNIIQFNCKTLKYMSLGSFQSHAYKASVLQQQKLAEIDVVDGGSIESLPPNS